MKVSPFDTRHGNYESQKGWIWVKHPVTKENKRIVIEHLDRWISKGYVRGMFRPTKSQRGYKMQYIISGDRTGVTYGVYEVREGEFLPPLDREPVVKGIETLKEASKVVDRLKKRK